VKYNMGEDEEISPENYANWFALYHLCKKLGDNKSVLISSIKFGDLLSTSQQTASRRIQSLEEIGWIKRKIIGKSQEIWVTEKGSDAMLNMYRNLKQILEKVLIVGEVIEGIGEGAYYVAIKGYFNQFQEKLGFEPFKGTLNLKLNDMNNTLLRENIRSRIPVIIEGFEDQDRKYGPVRCYDCIISRLDDKDNKRKAAILDIERTHHEKNIIEILAKPYLRDYFHLKDGDKLRVELI